MISPFSPTSFFFRHQKEDQNTQVQDSNTAKMISHLVRRVVMENMQDMSLERQAELWEENKFDWPAWGSLLLGVTLVAWILLASSVSRRHLHSAERPKSLVEMVKPRIFKNSANDLSD